MTRSSAALADAVDLGAKLQSAKSLVTQQRREIRELQRRVNKLQVAQDLFETVKNAPCKVHKVRKHKSARGHHAAAVVVASDWHAGETVTSASVNGLNSYDLPTFRKRAEAFFANAMRLVETQRQSVKIEELVFALLGDLMTGVIHHDLAISNSLQPPEELFELRGVLREGIRFFLQEGGFRRITIPCAYGNHGRMDKEKLIQNGARTSWEVFLYRILEDDFRDDDRVRVLVPDGPFVYTDIHGVKVRWTHLDECRGSGDVLRSVANAAKKWDQGIEADVTVGGHYHQLTFGPRAIINGSLIGHSVYSANFGHERPQQAFFLIDEKYGRTVCAPILVE